MVSSVILSITIRGQIDLILVRCQMIRTLGLRESYFVEGKANRGDLLRQEIRLSLLQSQIPNPQIAPQVSASDHSRCGQCSCGSVFLYSFGEYLGHSRQEDEPGVTSGGTRSHRCAIRTFLIIYQFRSKSAGIRNLWLLWFSLEHQKRLRTDSILSKNF